MKKRIVAALLIIYLLALTAEAVFIYRVIRDVDREMQQGAAATTLYLCNMARKGAPAYSLRNCYASEAHTNTEVLCNDTGCWIEQK